MEKRTQHKDTSQTGTYALVVGVLMVYNNFSSTKQMTKDELLSYCYSHKNDYIFDSGDVDEGVRMFECLIGLVEDGTVSSMEELADYGMEY